MKIAQGSRLVEPYDALSFLGNSNGKEFAYNVGSLGSTAGLERSHGEKQCNRLQYSCMEHSMDRTAWWVYSPWGCKELDTTAILFTHFLKHCI